MMTDQRITLEKLHAKLADLSIPEKDLSAYFRIDEERSSILRPALQLNPDTVSLPGDPAVRDARGDTVIAFANTVSRMRRRLRFERMLADGYTGPVVVSEGDSWFQFPIKLEDTIDHLYGKGFAVRSLGAAGDTLKNMLAEREYVDAIRETGATLFLLSAGGNDALGGGNLRTHLRDFDPSLSPSAHLLPSFGRLLDKTIVMYESVLRDVEALPGVVTLCHGYDYTIPNAGKWLGNPMASRGIVAPDFQRAIARQMIDTFNDRLKLLTGRFGSRAVYVDARGAVGPGLESWFDELHPKDAGYGRVADRFETAMNAVIKVSRTKTRSVRKKATAVKEPPSQPEASSVRRGWSLHVGLNKIDPGHYAGDDGELYACHFDAEDMARIARERGFEKVTVLLDAEATRDSVKGCIAAAADSLKAGDLFLVTYAGHGSQIPDFNADEEDGADETLCLFDGMLIDDELYELWSRFSDDVRIVMISDSCHSGSVIRGMRRRNADNDIKCKEAGRPRLLPLGVAVRTFREHRDFYTAIGRQFRGVDEGLLVKELNWPLRGSVLLISGCQDNQTSQDGMGNGRFTQELLQVWNEGRFKGNWQEFHRRILAGMPETQSPNLMLIGRSPETLASMPPFTI
jgi:lysophospholipase L1-like esterase